jgi:hypothetical protein
LHIPHDEFLAAYRRAPKSMGWPLDVIGAIMLTVASVLLGSDPDAAWPLALGCFYLLTGLTAVRCRRIVDVSATGSWQRGRS